MISATQIENEFLKEQSLMKGLTEQELQSIKKQLFIEKYLPNDSIIEEGDHSREVYLIAEGEVSVLKWDADHIVQLPIGRLVKGDMFGEMSFMDAMPRSTSIKATKETTVFKLPVEAIAANADIQKKIFANIALVNINIVRESNKLFTKNLQNDLTYLQKKQTIGVFLIYQLLILSVCAFLGVLFQENAEYTTWIFGLLPSLYLIKYFDYNRANFGLVLEKWSTILAAVVTAGIVLSLLFFAQYAFQKSLSESWVVEGRRLFSIPNIFESYGFSLFVYAVYCFSQEFIARGIILSSLQSFFEGEENQNLKCILIMAILILAFQLSQGYLIAIYSFFGSLFLGFIYLKQKSLLSVFLIHFLVGVLIL